jgi:hypothetical protein
MADANSLTLADYAQHSNEPLIRKIADTMLRFGSLLQDVPLVTYRSMFLNGTRFVGGAGNASVGHRKINETPDTTKGVPKGFAEQAYIMSNNIDIDTVLLDDQNSVQDPFNIQLTHYLGMVTYQFNDLVINNNHITGDPDAPIGLRWRLDNPTLFDIPTEMKIDANVDISAGSNGPALMKKIDQLLVRMGSPDGDGVVLYMNEDVAIQISFTIKLAGTSGGFSILRDNFDRSVTMYKNAVIRVIGRKADQTTQIITATETNAGADGASTYSSIYAVKYGEGWFRGWQMRTLEEAVRGPNLLDTGVQMRLTFDWPYGLFQEHPRAIGRIFDIKVS